MRLILAILLFFAVPSLAAATPFAMLCFGQSNMMGVYGPPPIVPPADAGVLAWDYTTNSWGTAQLNASPFYDPPVGYAHNPCLALANEIRHNLGLDVYIVAIASGGKHIEYFIPAVVLTANGWTNTETSPQFGPSASEELMGAAPYGDARPALASIGKTNFDLVVMSHGEAWSSDYLGKLGALFDELDARSVLTLDTTPILLTRINDFYSHHASHDVSVDIFAAAHSNVAVVEWDGIDTVPADPHASGKGLQQLGFRYFQAYAEMTGAF